MISLLFYAALNDRGDGLERGDEPNTIIGKGHHGSFSLIGREDEDNVKPPVQNGKRLPSNFDVNRIFLRMPKDDVWRMKDAIRSMMEKAINSRMEANGGNAGSLSPASCFKLLEQAQDGNVAIFQHTLSAPFTLEYAYVSNGPERIADDASLSDKYFGDHLCGF